MDQQASRSSDRATRREPDAGLVPWWIVASTLGVVLGVLCARTRALDAVPAWLAATASIAAGLVAILLFAPWPRIVETRRRRVAERELREALGRAVAGDDPGPLATRLEDAGRNASDELTRAAATLLRELAEHRRAARRLHRAIDEGVRRETHRQTLHLRKQARTDPLTGLANRRELEQRLQELTEEASQRPVVAMVLDLDRFKAVNDELGHEVGDGCLEFMGQLLRSSVRRGDTAVRMGGDEFVVLMPGQTLSTACRTADRLAALFRQMPWPHDPVPRPSVSVGLACATCAELRVGRRLLREADEALYRAKRGGRDRVEHAEPVSDAPCPSI